jgi:predicted nucleotidyltransferase
LRAVADRLRATVLRPYYPASGLFRVIRDDDGLQVDFMTSIHGVRSFEGLRDRATRMNIEGTPILVASLDDIIRSKRAARRPRDLAVIEVLEKAREAKASQAEGKISARRPRSRKSARH